MELQYDGTGLHGWAKQEGLPTVQGSLERAFETVIGHRPFLRVAGRTDAGVHAKRQVVSLELPADIDRKRLIISLNALTPRGIAVTRISQAPPGFNARRDAISRTYRYFLQAGGVLSPFWSPYCWRVPGALDHKAMHVAAGMVEGRHDFTAFTPSETDHVFFHRLVLRCEWVRGRDRPLALEIEAEAFLRHMVRTLVGTLVEIGRGKMALDRLERLLSGCRREESGPTAPPHGLVLWNVKYGRDR